MEFDLNTHSTTREVLETLATITRRSYGGTNTASGLAKARTMFTPELGDRDGHTNIAMILTDGHSNKPYVHGRFTIL